MECDPDDLLTLNEVGTLVHTLALFAIGVVP